MSNVVYLHPRPAPDVTEQLVEGLLDLATQLNPRSKADLLAFVHLLEDPSQAQVKLHIADNGMIRATLKGQG